MIRIRGSNPDQSSPAEPRLRAAAFTSRDQTATWLVLAGLAVTAIVVRVPFLQVPMIQDEGGYGYVARFWNDSYRLYRDIPFDRPQGIFLIYKAILGVVGGDVVAVRLGAAIWNAFTTLALFLFARETTGSGRAACAAALLFAVVSTSPSIEGFTANAELFTVLPLVLAAHLTWREHWLRAGLMAGLASLIKPIGVSGLLLTVMWIVRRRAGTRAAGAALLGYSSILVVALGHIAMLGWNEFWGYQQHKLLALASEPNQITALVNSAVKTYPAWLGLAVLTALGLSRAHRSAQDFGVLWVFASIAGMAIGRNWYWHYWTQLIPALACGAAPAFAQFRRSTSAVIVAAVAAMAIFCVRELPFWFADPKAVSWAVYGRTAYLVETEVADYVRGNTAPDDPIVVAFWEPAIYLLAERRASSPHLFRYEYLPTARAYNEVVESIRKQEPALVVWVNGPPTQWATADDFRRTLSAAGYAPRQSFRAVVVYGRSALAR